MRTRTHKLAAASAVLGLIASIFAGCGDSDNGGAEAVIDPGDGGQYEPEIDPANFVDRIDNRYLPYLPGSRWVYEGLEDGEEIRVEAEVTDQRREVMGISAVVVHELEYEAGELIEDTFDWYAQDREGNVWYLGEDSKEIEDGEVVSTEGSWEAGVDGALPGIIMLAETAVGEAYRQEYYEGEAEDMGEVFKVGETQTVAAGSYEGVLIIREWNPLEPDVIEDKYYAPGVGVVLELAVEGAEARVELIEYTPGA
jgi:hypothetical protein